MNTLEKASFIQNAWTQTQLELNANKVHDAEVWKINDFYETETRTIKGCLLQRFENRATYERVRYTMSLKPRGGLVSHCVASDLAS